jgi:hypothetical protein
MARLLSPANRLFGGRGIRKPNRFFLDPAHPLNNGLVSYWPFGDTNSGTAGGGGSLRGGIQDHGLLQNFGSVGGTLTSAAGHHGGTCAGFDGSTGFVQAPFNANSNSTTGTRCIWIKTGTLNGGWPLIWEHWDTVSIKNGVGIFISNSNSKIYCQVKKSDGTQAADLNNGPVVTDGVWHFVCLTYSPSGGPCELFVDGVSVATATASATWSFSTSVGQSWAKSSDSFFVKFLGSMSDARLYNRILTPTEIRQLYNEPYAGIYEFPVYLGSGASHAVITGTGDMSFGGISFVGAGGRSETGTANLAFNGISFNGAGSVVHVKGTGNMAFGGISIVGNGFNAGQPGGLRQFWTC